MCMCNSKVVEQSGKELLDLNNRNVINLIMSLVDVLKTNQNGGDQFDKLLEEKTIVKIRTKIDNLVDKIIVE